ncbi:MAG: agmatinase [Spirochaetota bacterium]|nr:agmatinase [Spirochaetota bacterium]
MESGFLFCSRESIEDADIVLAGFPYDCTASFRAGARFGPGDIRTYTGNGLEPFSFYFGEDLEDVNFFDYGDMDPLYGSPEEMVKLYQKSAAEFIRNNKILIAIGGEHLITLPIFQAASEKYGKFTMLHLDAHADLADQLYDSKLSHGTVMARCLDNGLHKLIQYGVRSGDRSEYEKRQNDSRIIPAIDIEEIADNLETGEKLYLTIDLDFFDPAFVPGTGTPEAGGADFGEYIKIFKMLRKKNVQLIGADLVELAPEIDTSRNSTIFAGKVLRELILTVDQLRLHRNM